MFRLVIVVSSVVVMFGVMVFMFMLFVVVMVVKVIIMFIIVFSRLRKGLLEIVMVSSIMFEFSCVFLCI